MGTAKDNITAKEQNTFVDLVDKGLREIGAIVYERNIDNTRFKLETTAGTLLITLYLSQTFLFTVYSRFEDPSKSRGKFNCNPYSGKYNFHMTKFEGRPLKFIIDSAIEHFECTLPKETA